MNNKNYIRNKRFVKKDIVINDLNMDITEEELEEIESDLNMDARRKELEYFCIRDTLIKGISKMLNK